ncbi:MAG: tetratricopeptide repeat protein [Verrucomicrobiota bacterium]
MHTKHRKKLFSGRLPLFSVVVLLLWAVAAGSILSNVEAQEIDPSDLWYTAFVRMKEGEAKEREQKALAAMNMFVESKRLFDAVARDHPDFHPSIVRYRRKELGDKIASLKTFLRNGGASSGAMPQAGGASGVQTGEVPNNPVNGGAGGAAKPAPTTPQGGANRALPSWDPEFANTMPSEDAAPGIPRGVPNGQVSNGRGSARPNAAIRPPQPKQVSPPSPQPVAGASGFTDPTLLIQQQFTQMGQKIKQLEAKNKSLNDAVASREAGLQNLKQQMAEAQRREKDLQRQMSEAQRREQDLKGRSQLLQKEQATADNAVAQVVILKKQLSAAIDALEKVNKQNRAILGELKNTREQLATLQGEYDLLKGNRNDLQNERDELEKERNQLAEIIESSGDGSKAVARLTKINAKLREDLTEARAYAETLAKSNGDKQIEVEMLREKIAEIAEHRKELMEANELHEARISQLEKRLKQSAKGLVQMAAEDGADTEAATASPEMVEENRLLRGVVLRQLRRQAQIKQAREMILTQLAELGVESDALLKSLDVISVTPGLTEDEKQLFRQPQVADLVRGMGSNSGASLQGAIIVEGGKKGGRSEEQRAVSVQDLEEELEQLQKVGQFDFSHGRYKDAERAYSKFLSYAPKNVEGICNLATVKLQLKEYAAAEELLKKSLSLETGNGRTYYLLGVVYFEQGKLDDALKHFDEGLQINPKNAKALNCVGVISSKKGWVKRAEESFTKAVDIDPDYADAHFNLSILYTSGEKPNRKKADKHYKKALNLGLPRDAKIEEVLNS